MSDFNLTARSPLCQFPDDPADARGLLLAGIDTLCHVKTLLQSVAEHFKGGEMLMIDVATDATIHALALLDKSLAMMPPDLPLN